MRVSCEAFMRCPRFMTPATFTLSLHHTSVTAVTHRAYYLGAGTPVCRLGWGLLAAGRLSERSLSEISRQIREYAPRRRLHEPRAVGDVPEIQIGQVLHLRPKGRLLTEQREAIPPAEAVLGSRHVIHDVVDTGRSRAEMEHGEVSR